MQYENFTFGEAMEALAERSGVELPKQEFSAEQRREADKRARLLEINKEAAKYYFLLLRSGAGSTRFPILKTAAVRGDDQEKILSGYSDQYSDDLYRYLRQKGYEDEILKESGLVTIDERRGGYE